MGWREKMGKVDFKPYTHNTQYPQNHQKNEKRPYFVDYADIADKNKNQQLEKSIQGKHDELWQKAWALADKIDDPGSIVPWQERTLMVPQLQEMSKELDRLEKLRSMSHMPMCQPVKFG